MNIYIPVISGGHLMPGFAHLFNKYYDPGRVVWVLHYEEKLESLPDNFYPYYLGKKSRYKGWNSAMIQFFSTIKDKQLLVMFANNWFIRSVDTNAWEEKNTWKKKNLIKTLYEADSFEEFIGVDRIPEQPDLSKLSTEDKQAMKGVYAGLAKNAK